MRYFHTGALAGLALLAANASLCAESSSGEEAKWIARDGFKASDWNAKAPNVKAEIIAKLRKMMTDDHEWYQENAHIALLDAGEEQTLDETIRRYKMTYWNRKKMARLMGRTTQVLLIPILADDLASKEPLQYKRYGSEFLDYPISVESSDVIRRIVINAPSLDADVKKWATGLSSQRPEELVEQMRKFWSKNSAAFVAKEYSKIASPK